MKGQLQLSQGMKLLEEQAVPGISASIDQVETDSCRMEENRFLTL